MEAFELWKFIQSGGLMAGFAVFIWALYTGRLRWGKDYDAMKSSLEHQLKESQTVNRGFIDKALAKLDRLEQRAEEIR